MEQIGMIPAFHATSVRFCYDGPLSFWWVCRRRQFPEKAPALPSPVLAGRVYVRLAQLLDPLNRLPSRRTRTLPSIEAFIERIVLNAGKRGYYGRGISMNKNTFRFPCSFEEIGPSRTQMVTGKRPHAYVPL